MLALIRVPASRTWPTPGGVEEFTSGPACLAAGWRSSTYASFEFQRSRPGLGHFPFPSSMPTSARHGTYRFRWAPPTRLLVGHHAGADGSVHARLLPGSPELDRFWGGPGTGFPEDTQAHR